MYCKSRVANRSGAGIPGGEEQLTLDRSLGHGGGGDKKENRGRSSSKLMIINNNKIHLVP